MKKVINFLFFLIYVTAIFFMPNRIFIIITIFLINLLISMYLKINLKKELKNLLNLLPFILFTFIFNCFLDTIKNSIYIGGKLLLVCNMTYIYSKTITIFEFAKIIEKLCTPLKILKINTEEIKLVVSICIAIFPIIKKDLKELKEASKYKDINLNIKNIKIILSKYLVSLIKRVNEIDEALIEKGYDY